MSFIRGTTYVWTDSEGTVHVWGRSDGNSSGYPAAVAIPKSDWDKMLRNAVRARPDEVKAWLRDRK